MFGTYAQALAHLNAFTDYERMAARYSPRTYNLRRMRRLVAALGHPERSFRSLHIAGTKGKGSVAHMAEAILREAGYRTGLYTSPHLVDMRERIRVEGEPVSRRDFVWAMNRMGPHLRRLRPTYFETMTAAAFLLFARRRVDYAVVEVGLGGRLDATNVIHPAACALTTVDYDHMDKLGRTLGAIAREKAGIVKPGVPVVSSPQRPAALREILKRARPFRPSVRDLRRSGTVVEFTVQGAGGRAYRCRLNALGDHQAVNAATAVALVEASGAAAAPGTVRRALGRLRLPGRVEVVGRRPWVVVDAAHNPVAARALAEALRALPRRRLVLVFGASADKDFRSMLRALAPGADAAVVTRARSPRAADPEELARHAGSVPAVVAPDVGRAISVARALARPSDAIVVTGSFYVAGEALALLTPRP
jgi:dihydrofolate synthase/folylpolyglutamate synthase